MQRQIAFTLGSAGFVLVLAGAVYAECGGYGPPAPPPGEDIGGPTTGGGTETGGPMTGGGGPTGGPTTGGGDIGGPTTGGGAGRGPTTGGGATGGPRTGGGLDRGHWSHWWYANRAFLLSQGTRARTHAAAKTGASKAATQDSLWRADVRRTLAAALSNDDDEVVAAAVLALGKGGDAADIPIVAKIATNRERGRSSRECAAMALGLLRADGAEDAQAAREALQSVVNEKKAPDRLRGIAVYALGLRQDDDCLPSLIAAASGGGSTWDVPAAGLTALGLSQSENARSELERLLQPAKRGNVTIRRVYAAHGLAKFGDPAALPVLLEALGDEDDEVRRAAALAVGALASPSDRDSVTALVRALDDDDDRGVRGMAALSLGLIGGDAALASLRKNYGRAEPALRPFAAVALGVLARRAERPEIARPLLRDLKRGARTELVGATCVAVGLAGFRDAAPKLRELATEAGDPNVRAQAAVSLALIGDRDEGPRILREILQESNDPRLRGEAALGLGLLGDMRTLLALTEMVENGKTEAERITACLALGRIGGRESADILQEVLSSEKRSDFERHMAANALGMLLDTSEGRRVGQIAADLDWYVLTPAAYEVRTEM